jgi:predicted dehydrogenase
MWALNRREFAKAAAAGAGAWAVGSSVIGASAAAGSLPASPPPPQRPAGGGQERAAGGDQAQGGGTPLAPPDKQPPNLELPRKQRKAGYAIVGLGKLALEEVMPAFGRAERSRPAALVSGHPDKARQVAEAYGVPPASIYDYGGFARLRDDAGVDVVYIILPNSMHAEYAIKALEAGKHVLCEKPMAVTSAECERMIAAARAANRKLMIAYRLHYEPYNRKVMEMCRQRALGTIKTFESSNGQTTRAPNIRLSKALGGGPVQDTGIYSINAGRYITGEEPVSVTAMAYQPKDDPNFREVPESVSYTLRYPSGILGHCDTSFGISESRRFRVHCADGCIDLDPAFSYRGQRLRVKRGSGEGETRDEEIVLKPVDHFAAEMDAFSTAVLEGGEASTPGEMGLADIRIIEAIEEAARTGRTVEVARS